MKKGALATIVLLCSVTIVGIYMLGLHHGNTGKRLIIGKEAIAAQTKSSASPIKAIQNRDVYYPGTEDLAPDEMRVVALGTGQPSVRPKQAASCFLVELGNGDKFLFDIGYGSVQRLAAMKIPMDYLDKVFVGHLHMDHFGDLDALWIGGVKMNRTYPLRVWGPSGATPEMGTKYAVDGLRRMLNWDASTLKGL